MSGLSSPSNSNSAWSDAGCGRDTIFYECALGPAPVSMETYEQTGDLTEGTGHKWPLFACSLVPELSRREDELVRRAKRFAKEQSVKYVMQKMQEKQQKTQIQNLKRAQALLLLSRIYVGSINFDVTDEMLTEAFQTYGPVKACNMGFDNASRKHKGYAFVEFELPEAATLAIDGMNNYLIGGRNLKVSRPSNIPNPGPVIDELVRDGSLHSRVYVANVHSQLTEVELRSVFEAFGSLVSCRLEPDPNITGCHRGFGFVEYSTPDAAIEAISSMHGFDLGGQLLRVGRAITPPNLSVGTVPTALPPAAALAAASITAQLLAQRAVSPTGFTATAPSATSAAATAAVSAKSSEAPHQQHPQQLQPPQPHQQAPAPPAPVAAAVAAAAAAGMSERHQQQLLEDDAMMAQQPESVEHENDFIRGQEARRLVMRKLMMRAAAPKVLLLRNMVTPDDLDDALESEVSAECGKFGNVQRVVILEQPDAVRVFVEFEQPAEAEAARSAMAGRFFGGREVRADLYEQELWESGDFTQ